MLQLDRDRSPDAAGDARWAGIFGGNAPGLPTQKGKGPAVARSIAGASAASVQRAGDLDLPGAAREGAAAIVRDELKQVRAVYTGVDVVLTEAVKLQADTIADLRARLAELLGGKDPLRLLVTQISEGLDHLNAEVSQMMAMGVVAGNAKQRADTIVGYSDDAVAAVDAIKVPTFQVAQDGGGGVIDAAAQLLQKQLVNRVAAQAQSLVDGVKEAAKAPISVVHDNASEIAEFSVIVQQTAEHAVGQIQERIAKFSAAIGRCDSIEDIVDTMINQAFEAIGLGEGFTVADAVAQWKEIGPLLDQADALVAAHAGPAPASDDDDRRGPVLAVPPPEEPA